MSVKNLRRFTSALQILRKAQDDKRIGFQEKFKQPLILLKNLEYVPFPLRY